MGELLLSMIKKLKDRTRGKWENLGGAVLSPGDEANII